MAKQKIYEIEVAEIFPKWHSRAGEETNFAQGILNATATDGDSIDNSKRTKRHTIRDDFQKWFQILSEVNAGVATLKVVAGEKTITTIDKNSGAGVQMLSLQGRYSSVKVDGKYISIASLALNDALIVNDLIDFFKHYGSPNEMLAIVHFTDFRY